MMKYEVLVSGKSLEDMEAIYSYIAEKLFSPIAAMKQYNRIAEAILSLERMPERIKVMDSEPERSQGIRKMDVDRYSVIFTIYDKAVSVVRVLYSASDISQRLAE